jgi:hypothetical protein
MKKLFLLFALVFAVACDDNSVQQPEYDIRQMLNGGRCMTSENNSGSVKLTTGEDFFSVDNWLYFEKVDSTFKKFNGKYIGTYSKNNFKGSFIDSIKTKHSIDITIISVQSWAFKGEHTIEDVSGNIEKTSFTGGACLSY